jgi:hypothetical protein
MELEKIPSFIAVASFAALSCIVAGEWGYFGVIGREFQSFFATSDYVSDLLVSIGPVFMILLGLLALQIAVYRMGNFESKSPQSRLGKIFDWYQELSWLVIFILAVLFTDETRRFSLYIFLGLLWFRTAAYIYSHVAFDTIKRSIAGLLILVLPSLMIVAYGIGRDAAYADLKDTKDRYRLLYRNREFSQSVKILRLLDKGAIVVDPETDAVEFHPREDIVLLEHDGPKWDTKSFACQHWGWDCDKAVSK